MPNLQIDPFSKELTPTGEGSSNSDQQIKALIRKIVERNEKAGKADPFIVCCEKRGKPGSYRFLDLHRRFAGWHNNAFLILEGRLRVCSIEEVAEAIRIEEERTKEANERKAAVKFEKGVAFLGEMVKHTANTDRRKTK